MNKIIKKMKTTTKKTEITESQILEESLLSVSNENLLEINLDNLNK